ncbi:14543_t:CDS:2 [Entrophospora sp. SA101]|nr:579_t:CDS:2 [Entrophospora sp. SA101]CAJ0744991.1 8410_t:CDS:2 [Entrophospora sp. SA101]CAJ0758065.1 14543_t:CDS:2 [Entrophospora sp. SA101]
MTAIEKQINPASPFTPQPPSSPLSTTTVSSPATPRSHSPSVFEVFPIISENPLIRGLTASHYYRIHETYYTQSLPNNMLFPWLHGVDGSNVQQNNFFCVNNCPVPEHRGITLIQADEGSERSQLIGSVFPMADGEGINLRNFKIQVAKYATISDIIVYGEDGLNENVLKVAKQVAWAQQILREQRPIGINYETFVILDPFSVFEKDFLNVVAIDNKGIWRNKINFPEQEREEMRILTAASEISPNVWLGNTQDVPISTELDPADSAISLIDDNPHHFCICIEAHDLGEIPDKETLQHLTEGLSTIPKSRPISIKDIIHVDCMSSAVGCNSTTSYDSLITKLLDLCEFISEKANNDNRKILIHCADGYTETSLLALTYLMYNETLRLPQAYLRLQKTRSFFVYPSDVTTLLNIEKRVLERKKVSQDERDNIEISNKFSWFYSSQFEGSFPSRILPFLYLGNLSHACNAGMLKALGITHVLSVGEDARLDGKEFDILYLGNLYDDGIDSLWNHLDLCVNFIENARRLNGSVIIHCRVGVSRSATITIAYIMRHLGRSLVSSYLFVRARRLNVIIQPNLKFMYELLQYEQKLTGRMGISWPWLAKEINALNMCYVGS